MRDHNVTPTTGFAAALVSALAAATLVGAPSAAADASATLAQMIVAERGSCGPLEADPVLTALAQRANRETQQYEQHLARFEPFEDPMPALHDLGYPASKAKLLSGYGDVEQKAMDGVVLYGWEAIPDCSYTRYGADVLNTGSYT